MSDTDNLNPISTLTSQDNFEDLAVLYLFVVCYSFIFAAMLVLLHQGIFSNKPSS
jgi:hypothetical protein